MALTLLKPGDVWDHQEWTRRLVGMRLCEKCIPRFTALMLRGYKPDVFRITFFGSIMLFAGGLFVVGIIAFSIAGSLSLSPKIPAFLFLASLLIFYGGILGRWVIARLAGEAKKISSMPTAQSAPLVSIAELFNGPIETNRGKC